MKKLLLIILLIPILTSSCSKDDNDDNSTKCWEVKRYETSSNATYNYEKSMTEEQIKAVYPSSEYKTIDCDLLFTPEAKTGSKSWYIRVTGEPKNIIEVCYYKNKSKDEIIEIMKQINDLYKSTLKYTIYIQYYEIDSNDILNKYLKS